MKFGSLHDIILDDARDFKVCDNNMSHLGLNEDEKLSIYTIVASVLHLGNIMFEEDSENAKGKELYISKYLMK